MNFLFEKRDIYIPDRVEKVSRIVIFFLSVFCFFFFFFFALVANDPTWFLGWLERKARLCASATVVPAHKHHRKEKSTNRSKKKPGDKRERVPTPLVDVAVGIISLGEPSSIFTEKTRQDKLKIVASTTGSKNAGCRLLHFHEGKTNRATHELDRVSVT